MRYEPVAAYRFLTEKPLGAYRFRAAFGGRGSAKSWEVVNAAIFHSLITPRLRVVFLREIMANLKESSLELVRSRLEFYGLLGTYFTEVDGSFIGRGGQKIMFIGLWKGGKPEGIKSLEGAGLTILEEAQEVRQKSMDVLIPTVLRTPISELWAIWNPALATDPVDVFFRGDIKPKKAILRKINYDQNPHFPEALQEQMELDRRKDPLRAAWIWDGAYMPGAQNALWTRDMIDRAWLSGREKPMDALGRVVVGVDPAGGGGDEVGIVVAGRYGADAFMVLDDFSCEATSPNTWALQVLRAVDTYGADCVVVERNYGGDMVRSVLQNAGVTCQIVDVVATRGKAVRAEPVAALYEADKVHHAKQLPHLESQMMQMTPNGYAIKGASPDRLDGMVWALTELSKKQREIWVA